jgi:hypothetical protein
MIHNIFPMKRFIVLVLLVLPVSMLAQETSKVLGTETVRRVSVGAEIYQDFWLNEPDDMDVRGFNQGAGTFVTYSFPLGKSPLSFAIGAGVGFHNLYSNTLIEDITADTIRFIPIADSISYKKSKLGLAYLDFPIEFRLKTKKKVNVSAGIKLGYLLDAKTKYKGDNENGDQILVKTKDVAQVDKFRFGPTVRVGYNWVQVYAFYSVTSVFEKNRGPGVYPISLGITFMPF